MSLRSVVWAKDDPPGLEFADVLIAGGRLTATGIAIGTSPVAYRLDYKLETRTDFVTSGLLVTARGDAWRRRLDLRRHLSGRWSARTVAEGHVALPAPGGDLAEVRDALDCDLGLSPLTNSMPVLREGLLHSGGPLELVMAWVSVPDLGLHRSVQHYTFVRHLDGGAVVRFESGGDHFAADLTFDAQGIVVDYPGIGRLIS